MFYQVQQLYLKLSKHGRISIDFLDCFLISVRTCGAFLFTLY